MSLTPVEMTLRCHPNARDLAVLLVAAEQREVTLRQALEDVRIIALTLHAAKSHPDDFETCRYASCPALRRAWSTLCEEEKP